VSINLFPGSNSQVDIGGTAVIAVPAYTQGAIIWNPFTPTDQGVSTLEELYVCLNGPASLIRNDVTEEIQPGQMYYVPANLTTNVWVNAQTSGHKFSVIVLQYTPQYPPTPVPGTFPPNKPTGLTQTIPSYLYQQYTDDDDLQSFVNSYNKITQNYVDTFNDLNLPIYTSATISGLLLDWVATGLYGLRRPALYSGQTQNIGAFNSFMFNQIAFNEYDIIYPTDAIATNDDIYKRILTWFFFKGDGKVFNVRWLKRRIMRFLFGENGTNPLINQTYQVSVTFGTLGEVTIRLVTTNSVVTGGEIFNECMFNDPYTFNQANAAIVSLSPLPNAVTFKEAVDTAVLELPFQFTYNVVLH